MPLPDDIRNLRAVVGHDLSGQAAISSPFALSRALRRGYNIRTCDPAGV